MKTGSKTSPDSPIAATRQPADVRTRSALRASLRDELVAPLTAVARLADTLHKDAAERGPDAFAADLAKIRAAGERLLAMIDELFDPARACPGDDDLLRRVRHELRTPLNHVLGYCDLWLDEADNHLLAGFVADLQAIRRHGQRSLALLDELMVFLKRASDPDIDLAGDPPPTMVLNVAAILPNLVKAHRTAANPSAILVVDDNESNRDLLSRWLQREGHAVSVAENGERALELVKAQRFDLVLLDVIMPKVNGFQVLERLKHDESLRHIPVIMLSALDEVDGVVRCIECGAEDYLTKPFNTVLLRARINAGLEKKQLRDREVQYLQQIRTEQALSDELLHVILPGQVVRELKATKGVLPRRYENVAVLFADIVGFTPFCDGHPPEHVVKHLQGLIESWEEIALRHHVEKIKTIGDAFMAAGGLLYQTTDHPVLHALRCGVEMVRATRALAIGWDLRVGIHFGPVVAGVIGRRQFQFDLWGDTVNTAARMESHGVPGHVVLSGSAWTPVASLCRGQSRGELSVKGKGRMEMFRFDGFLDE
jgi:class 3 adenylate cyclase